MEKTNAIIIYVEGEVITMPNKVTLSGASDLSVARTIIQEMVHAYLTQYFRKDEVNAERAYPQVDFARIAVKNPDLNEIHHNGVEKNFLM